MLDKGRKDENLMNVFNKHDLGDFSFDEIITYFSKLEGVTSTEDEIRKEIDGYLRLDEKLADLILKLKSSGFKTMLLSNADSKYFEEKIYKCYPQFKSLFNEIVISSDVKMIKPNKDIYLYALEKIKSKPKECLFIDDSRSNVDAAIELGINGFLYTNFETFLDYIKTLDI